MLGSNAGAEDKNRTGTCARAVLKSDTYPIRAVLCLRLALTFSRLVYLTHPFGSRFLSLSRKGAGKLDHCAII